MASQFGFARVVIGFVQFTGMMALCGGVGGAVGVLLFAPSAAGEAQLFALVAGGGAALVGLVLVVLAQLALAQIVTADSVAELVALHKAGARKAALDAPSIAPSSQAASGIVKHHKGRPIWRDMDGTFSVPGAPRPFASVTEAQTWIDRNPS